MPLPELPANVRAALARGDKIEAIKLLRQATGLGLAEAKHALDAHAQGLQPQFQPAPGVMPAAVTEALRRGQKIEAIRLYREHAGVGLKEAKDAVDAMVPGLAHEAGGLSPGEVAPASAAWLWIVVALGLAGGAAYWWLG